jgi:hypothetical protein
MGTDLRTNSVFVNDQWHAGKLTFNLGVRWDGNQGEDAAGHTISDSSKWSPRLAAVFDPRGDGVWAASGSFARYVTALNTGIADVSPGGNSSTYQWPYLGPAVNPDPNGALMTTPQAIQTLFTWFNANGGTGRPFSLVDIPGVSSRIGDSLDSPNADEWAVGISRQIGGRGSVRADFVSRNYNDFYAARTDTTTGRVTDPIAGTLDLTLLENTNVVNRTYQGVTFQATYRFGSRVDMGGKLHNLESVREFRRRERDHRSRDDEAAVVSGVRGGALEQPRRGSQHRPASSRATVGHVPRAGRQHTRHVRSWCRADARVGCAVWSHRCDQHDSVRASRSLFESKRQPD